MGLRDLNTAEDHVAVTASDSTVYNPPFRALYVGTGGTVVIESPLGVDVSYIGVPTGSILPVSGQKVKAATTAMNIVALF